MGRRALPEGGGRLLAYRHEGCGLKHFHFEIDDEPHHNFVVALPSAWGGDDGRAHALEHWVMCGSRRFPGPAPWASMLDRSGATVFNAQTHDALTAYFLATPDRQDMAHLLTVCLDAVWAPLLRDEDFAREVRSLQGGGVVLHEMRGHLANPVAQTRAALNRRLMRGTALAGLAGGTPEGLIGLRPEQVRRFHQQRYRPDRAVFLSAGPGRPDIIHTAAGPYLRGIHPGKRLDLPRARGGGGKFADPIHGNHTFQVLLAWPAGDAFDPESLREASLFSEAWVGEGNVAFTEYLECHGDQASLFCGQHSCGRDLFLVVGVEGEIARDAKAGERLLLDAIARVRAQGLAKQSLALQAREHEYAQRVGPGPGMPRTLHHLLEAALPALYGERPSLDGGAVLQKSKARWLDTRRATRWLDTVLARPPTRLHLLPTRQRAAPTGKPVTVFQTEPRDITGLPCVEPEKLTAPVFPKFPVRRRGRGEWVPVPGCGLLRLGLATVLRGLTIEERAWVRLAAQLLVHVGVERLTARQAERTRHACRRLTPRFSGDQDALHVEMIAEGLAADRAGLAQALALHWHSASLDHRPTVKTMAEGLCAWSGPLVAEHGPAWTLSRAMAGCSPMAQVHERDEGQSAWLLQTALIRRLTNNEDKAWTALAKGLTRMRQGHLTTVAVGERADLGLQALERALGAGTTKPVSRRRYCDRHVPTAARHWAVALLAETPVEHHAWAVPAPPANHPDAVALAVLSQVLSRRLDARLRQHGLAYASAAAYFADHEAFALTCGRTTDFEATVRAMEATWEEARAGMWSNEETSAGIRRTLQHIDRLPPILDAAERAWRDRDGAHREHFRQEVATCTPGALASAHRWFKAQPHKVALVHPSNAERAERAGFLPEPLGPESGKLSA